MFSSSNRKPSSYSSTEDAAVDPRDIDKILSELAGMIGRWRLFRKFIVESLKVCLLPFVNRISDLAYQEDHPQSKEKINAPASPETAAFLDVSISLNASESQKIFEDLTTQYYVTLEVWYIRTSIDKVTCSLFIVHPNPYFI